MTLTAEGKERLDRFVARKLPDHSRSKIAQAIKDGLVAVGQEIVTRPSFELRPGDAVTVGEMPASDPHDLTPFHFDLDVRYEDEHMLVVNKPRGMVSHPGHGTGSETLVNALLARAHALSSEGGAWRPGIVHRLDKETTGLMMVAKTDAAHRSLAAQIKAKTAQRLYVALAYGRFDQAKFKVQAPIGRHPGIPSMMTVKKEGREAVSNFAVIGRPTEQGTMLVCRLETGRTHQIRVHLSSIGHPVKGDKVYAKKPWNEGAMQLHAVLLAFDHPTTNERVTVYAEPPEDFEARAMATQGEVEKCL